MLTFVEKYKQNIFSQCGEDGIIGEVHRRMNKTSGVCIEFGAHDGKFCSNTRLLLTLVDHSWKGHMYEADPELFQQCMKNCFGLIVNVENKMITTENINDLSACDLISFDTDGEDAYLWQAYNGQPDIVIIEINSSLPPMVEHASKEKGASYISMLKLGIEKGYFLLCHTGNLIFALNKHRELFPEIVGDGIENYSDYFNKSWL